MSTKEEPDDAKFESKLDKKSREKAIEELGEDEKERLGAVQLFRHLVLQQPWLRTPTDFSFLLRFLRASKFNPQLALQQLENYWTIKTKAPSWFGDLDPADKKLQEFIRCGFYYSPMKTDKEGRRLIIERVGNVDINDVWSKYGIEIVFKNIVLVCEWVLTDENVQVNGLEVLDDLTGVTMGHQIHVLNLANAKIITKFYQKSLPARMKAFHMYNEPPFFDIMSGILKLFMTEKMRNRTHFHGKNMATVYELVDKSVLPDEYLPDDYTGPSAGPEKQIIEDMITDMNKPEFRNYIKDLTSDKYGIDMEQSKSGMHTVVS